MAHELRVTTVDLTPGTRDDERSGLLGFVRLVLNDALVLDGLTLRRSTRGRAYVCYPKKTSRSGAEFPYVRPVDDATREAIDAEVLRLLGVREQGW